MKKRTLKKSVVMREGYIKGLKKAQRILSEMAGGIEPTTDMYERISEIMSKYKSMSTWRIRTVNEDSAKIEEYDADYRCYTTTVYFSKMFSGDCVKISADGSTLTMEVLQCIMEIAQLF